MTSATFSHVAITGGGGGIGAALAVEFSRRGARVALCGRSLEKVRAAAARCLGETSTRACDVTRAGEIKDWVLSCDEDRPIDCLVACAGVGGEAALAGEAGESAAAARRILEVNAVGVVNTISPLLPRLVARRSGRVVIISSLAGLVALPDSPAYSASKAAVIVYGESLRRLLRTQGVAVTVVCPGFVDTPMVRSLPFRPPFMWTPERAAAVIVDGIARGRPMVSFPWQMRAAIGVSRIFPRPIVDRLIDRLRAESLSK